MSFQASLLSSMLRDQLLETQLDYKDSANSAKGKLFVETGQRLVELRYSKTFPLFQGFSIAFEAYHVDDSSMLSKDMSANELNTLRWLQTIELQIYLERLREFYEYPILQYDATTDKILSCNDKDREHFLSNLPRFYQVVYQGYDNLVKKGFLNAQLNLAHCHMYGIGTAKNSREALKLFQDCTDSPERPYCVSVALYFQFLFAFPFYYSGRQNHIGVRHYLPRNCLDPAENFPHARLDIVRFYQNGEASLGFKQDFQHALFHLNQIKDLGGYPTIPYLFGLLYLNGKKGEEQNTALGIQHIQKAAGGWQKDALSLLGHFHTKGIFVPQDLNYAFLLCSLSVDVESNSDAQGKVALANIYMTEQFKNSRRATLMYQVAMNSWEQVNAAREDFRSTFCRHHSALLKPTDIQLDQNIIRENEAQRKAGLDISDPKKFVEFLEKEKDYSSLGFCYQFGCGVKRDLLKAIEHYMAAIKEGQPCFLDLYTCYRSASRVMPLETLKPFLDLIVKLINTTMHGNSPLRQNATVCLRYLDQNAPMFKPFEAGGQANAGLANSVPVAPQAACVVSADKGAGAGAGPSVSVAVVAAGAGAGGAMPSVSTMVGAGAGPRPGPSMGAVASAKKEGESKEALDTPWHFDSSLPYTIEPGKKYTVIPAGDKDKEKALEAYRQGPVPGYDIARVEIIVNPILELAFSSCAYSLQLRSNTPASAPTWDQDNEPEWRKKINGLCTNMSHSYLDLNAPAVKFYTMWHGTKKDILGSLFSTGYLNLATTDAGYFGKGIYSAYEPEYAYKTYSDGTLIMNWVVSFSAYPVIDGDMPKLHGKGNHKNYDAHFAPVVPEFPEDESSKSFLPCKPNQCPKYTEMVVFTDYHCLPRYLVTLQPSLPSAVRPEVSHRQATLLYAFLSKSLTLKKAGKDKEAKPVAGAGAGAGAGAHP